MNAPDFRGVFHFRAGVKGAWVAIAVAANRPKPMERDDVAKYRANHHTEGPYMLQFTLLALLLFGTAVYRWFGFRR